MVDSSLQSALVEPDTWTHLLGVLCGLLRSLQWHAVDGSFEAAILAAQGQQPPFFFRQRHCLNPVGAISLAVDLHKIRLHFNW